jgi:hypothetical protein
MRHLPLLFLAGISITLSAQTPGATGTGSATGSAMTQSGNTAASFAQGSSVSAELTKKVDTKNAKVGDEVLAKTTGNAQLSDGTKVPKGTRLVGQVTEVQAKSAAEKTSHLAFAVNRAILRDGREVPMHAMLTSVSAPAAMASGSASEDLETPMGGVSGAGAASGGGSTGGGGGLLGGAGRATSGVVGGAGSVAGNTTSGLQSTTNNTLRTTESAGSNGLGAVANAGSSTATQLNHVAVPNMPGITLSNAANSSSSGSFDAAGKNISLDSGTQMTMRVSAN